MQTLIKLPWFYHIACCNGIAHITEQSHFVDDHIGVLIGGWWAGGDWRRDAAFWHALDAAGSAVLQTEFL